MIDPIVIDGLLTIAEAEEFSGLKKSYLYALCDAGELAWVSVGKRGRRIPRRALEEWASRNLVRRGEP